MAVRDVLLPVLDLVRGAILDRAIGLRQFDVSIIVNQWIGGAYAGAPGSIKQQTVTPLTVAGGARVKVSNMSSKDIIASGGLYQEQDIKIGPFTPQYTGGGTDPSIFDPPVLPGGEVVFSVVGPGFPAGTLWKKIGSTTVPGNFRYEIVLRKTGQQNA